MSTLIDRRFEKESATPRQLKVLIALLVVSNIGLGIFSFYLLRRIDQRYSELIESSVPVLSDLQDITVMSVQLMRLTNVAQFTDAGRPGPWLANARKVLADERLKRATIVAADWITAGVNEKRELNVAGEEFSRLIEQAIAQLATDRIVDERRQRDEVLRPAFDRYLTCISKIDDFVESESRRANQVATQRTGVMSAWVLSVASWPVVLLLAILLVTAIMVFILMIAFRDSDLSSDIS